MNRKLSIIVATAFLLGAVLLSTSTDALPQLGYLVGIRLQGTTPGMPDVGHANISGTMIAGSFVGDGSGLSNLSASAVSGTVSRANLPAAIAYTDVSNTFSLSQSFSPFIQVAGGSEAAPGYSFISDKDTGLFSAVFDTIGISTNGMVRLLIADDQVGGYVPIVGTAGSETTPGFSFQTFESTGIWFDAANGALSLSTAGIRRFLTSGSAVQAFQPLVGVAGSATIPSLTFAGNTSTGFFSLGGNAFSLTAGGAARMRFSDADVRMQSTLPFLANGGAAFTPGLSFHSDPDTGLYRTAVNTLGMAAGGNSALEAATSTVRSFHNFQIPAGTAVSPSLQFTGDLNSGIYNPSADVVAFATGGAIRGAWTANGALVVGSGTTALTGPGLDVLTRMTMSTEAGSPTIALRQPSGVSTALMTWFAPDHGRVTVHDNAGVIQAEMRVVPGAPATGSVIADVKNFRVPNPDDPTTDIWYACPEGPEAAMYCRGTARLSNGEAVIELPAHFRALALEQGLTVQVTPLSEETFGLAVVGKSLDGILVHELRGGRGSFEFDWRVEAARRGLEDYRVVRPWDDGVADSEKPARWKARLEKLARIAQRSPSPR